MAAPNQTESLSSALASGLAGTTLATMPTGVVEAARRAVLDWLGAGLAGAHEAPARAIREWTAGLGRCDEATVMGGSRAAAASAALANGAAAHCLEVDDLHTGAAVHAGAPVIAAAWAVAEREHASGASLLAAVVAGYEATLRIGEAVHPSHYRSWHPTGTVTTFGAAVAAAHLLKLPPTAMAHALGTAGTQAAGLWEFNADGAMSKPLHAGKAAFNGILAADLAGKGFSGAERILEGERGFFRTMSTESKAGRVLDGLGERWGIMDNGFKLHGCCGHTHTTIDAILKLRERPRAWEEIAAIEIETYSAAMAVVAQPKPHTPQQARFSLAYVAAAAWLDGSVGPAHFEGSRFGPSGVVDARMRALMARVRCEATEELTAQYPEKWPARVRVRMADGSMHAAHCEIARGQPGNPVSTAELETKFFQLVSPLFGAPQTERLLVRVRKLEDAADVGAILGELE